MLFVLNLVAQLRKRSSIVLPVAFYVKDARQLSDFPNDRASNVIQARTLLRKVVVEGDTRSIAKETPSVLQEALHLSSMLVENERETFARRSANALVTRVTATARAGRLSRGDDLWPSTVFCSIVGLNEQTDCAFAQSVSCQSLEQMIEAILACLTPYPTCQCTLKFLEILANFAGHSNFALDQSVEQKVCLLFRKSCNRYLKITKERQCVYQIVGYLLSMLSSVSINKPLWMKSLDESTVQLILCSFNRLTDVDVAHQRHVDGFVYFSILRWCKLLLFFNEHSEVGVSGQCFDAWYDYWSKFNTWALRHKKSRAYPLSFGLMELCIALNRPDVLEKEKDFFVNLNASNPSHDDHKRQLMALVERVGNSEDPRFDELKAQFSDLFVESLRTVTYDD